MGGKLGAKLRERQIQLADQAKITAQLRSRALKRKIAIWLVAGISVLFANFAFGTVVILLATCLHFALDDELRRQLSYLACDHESIGK